MSGNALGPYNDPIQDRFKVAQEQGKALGIRTNSSEELLSKLREVNAVELVESVDKLKVYSFT